MSYLAVVENFSLNSLFKLVHLHTHITMVQVSYIQLGERLMTCVLHSLGLPAPVLSCVNHASTYVRTPRCIIQHCKNYGNLSGV